MPIKTIKTSDRFSILNTEETAEVMEVASTLHETPCTSKLSTPQEKVPVRSVSTAQSNPSVPEPTKETHQIQATNAQTTPEGIRVHTHTPDDFPKAISF